MYIVSNVHVVIINLFIWNLDMCLLTNDVYDYNIISQGKTTIPGVDDGEECTLTDVSLASV